MTSLKTKRLILRPWNQEDFEPFAQLNADSRMMEYFPALLTKAESNERAKTNKKKIEDDGWGKWAVSIQGSTEFIGMIGLFKLEKKTFQVPFCPAVAVVWNIAVQHWGKGYATEGAKAAIEYAFQTLEFEEIVAFTVPQNARSRRVMEKIGMRYDPKDDFHHPNIPAENRFSRQVLYRISKIEWQNQLRY